MATSQDSQQYIRRTAVDAEGNRIGKISQVYLDDQTGQPLWLLVETGLFGARQSFAPVDGSGSRASGSCSPCPRTRSKTPLTSTVTRTSNESEQDALRQYYRGFLGTAEETSG